MIHFEGGVRRSFGPTLVLTALLAIAGCATTDIAPSRTTNPPPAEPFSAFQHFELEAATLAPESKDGAANERAFAKIQENLELNVRPLLQQWEADADEAASSRTLVIQPHVSDLKFVSGGARAFGGALRGSSAVVMEVTLTDKATGEVIARPEFFQRAAAMGGAWSGGGTDNHMLARIAQIAAEYLRNNYDRPVGGPTGG